MRGTRTCFSLNVVKTSSLILGMELFHVHRGYPQTTACHATCQSGMGGLVAKVRATAPLHHCAITAGQVPVAHPESSGKVWLPVDS
eukprot:1471603-Amphidinium_carterae.1